MPLSSTVTKMSSYRKQQKFGVTKVWRISLKAITDIKNSNVLANKVWQNSIDLPNSPNFNHAKLLSFMYSKIFNERLLI